ncbi:BTB/POZ protein [Rhizophagus clarus]|uniref:BTB/POZ protein n=1 Tax=Rhizophagus clarus TaxID=94130 RepID=A0A8H3QY57_9GLOM|nr:BTB/POZ protein [Rhizophagus clarus]
MDDSTFLPKLSQNLLEILKDNEYYDITIEVVRRILSTNKKRIDGILTHIKLPNISPEIFQIILRYIYGGRLSLNEYDTLSIIKILIVANELGLQELITYLQSFLIKNKENWVNQNFNLIYQTSFNNDSFLKLQNICIELMSKEPEKIFNSIDFDSISEKCLITLIKQDDIQLDDIQIWERVVKWGIAQNPELPSDPLNYSKYDFNILKNTLQQFIPFIKFYNLSSEEFLNNVYPYKKIIPKELREDLIKYFLNPNNQSIKNLNSKSKDNIENYILSRVETKNLAIFNLSNYGPSFNGLVLYGDNHYNESYCKDPSYYEKPIRETVDRFSVEEYEIFQITKGLSKKDKNDAQKELERRKLLKLQKELKWQERLCTVFEEEVPKINEKTWSF